MTFKHMILGTVAAGSMMVAMAAIEPAVFSPTTESRAATNVSVNIGIGTFYDRLAPYGNWVSYHDRYVWLPEHRNAHWRPYTEGHWAYTRRYGWLWVSNERFGWATYHYGRWGYARDIGWYWVPGRRWAPAWVAWSHSNNDIAWAPLPPDRYDGVNVSISFGDIPDYYWQAVPVSGFLSINISDHVIRDRNRVRSVLKDGKPRTVRIENNIVVNNVIKVDDIERRTKKKVVVLEEKAVDNPDAVGKADSKSVAIFNPDVKEEASAKPKKTRKFEEVVKERKAKGIAKQEQPADQFTEPAVTSDEPVAKSKDQKAADTAGSQDEQLNADQPVNKKKKKKDTASTGQQDTQPIMDAPDEAQAPPTEKKKKKKDAAATAQGNSEPTMNAPAQEQVAPVENKRKKDKTQQPENTDGAVNPECDPAIEECPPLQ